MKLIATGLLGTPPTGTARKDLLSTVSRIVTECPDSGGLSTGLLPNRDVLRM
jgi:hypothetical protein